MKILVGRENRPIAAQAYPANQKVGDGAGNPGFMAAIGNLRGHFEIFDLEGRIRKGS